MLKHLTFALSAAVLSACTIVSDDSASDGNSNTASDTNNTSGTTGTTTDGPTTANPTTGTTGEATTSPTSGTTGEEPTTGVTTTGATTIGTMTEATTEATTIGTMTEGTTGGDTESTTQGTIGTDTDTDGGLYGNCGWNVVGFYACADMGGVPGAEDPMMTDPIACPPNVMEGAACNDMGMGGVGSVGCCTPEGVNYFCDIQGDKKVFKDDCAL